MPTAVPPSRAFAEPIRIRYDGLDAERHEIELSSLADSLKGLSRILGVAGNFAATEKYVQHKDAMAVRVVVGQPEAHCYEIVAYIVWAANQPLLAGAGGTLLAGAVSYIIAKAVGRREEMRQLRGALETAIRELGSRDQNALDRALATIDRMADALRPAVRQAVQPLGTTATTLTVATAERAVVLNVADRDAVMADVPPEITNESDYIVRITELDMETGNCRIALIGEDDARIAGRIVDPAFAVPNNPYVTAMAACVPLRVRAKASIRDGSIERLYLSDATGPATA